ncbi:MAG TPA: Gfo/Idh/MocA family oxidoreductase [Chthonomonadaceae bacterium]|nr:Gfo/Idh/MocA family oxidoreductase [Chthonomonadaceae bacterium]
MRVKEGGVIRVGIAGLGRAGWDIHVDALRPLTDQYAIVAVCDPLPDRRTQAREELGCAAYSAFPELLADARVELVVVATPSYLHAEMAIAALETGKHVIVEKPFATDLADAERMIATAKQTGRTLTCHQNSRYSPDYLKVREVIASGKLGQILQIRIAWHGFSRRWDWQTLKEFGGGMLNNNGSHAIDLALLLMGEVEPQVFCQRRNTPLSSGDAEDHVKVVLQAPGAPLLDVELTSACAYAQDAWLVMGTQGSLTGTRSHLKWKYLDPVRFSARPVDRHPTPDRSYNREDLSWVEETWDLSQEHHTPPTQQIYRDLYATLREEAPLAISLPGLQRQSRVLQKCRES